MLASLQIQTKIQEFKNVVVVLPAYNAERTLKATLNEIPKDVSRVILVDDESTDNTVEVAKSLGLEVHEHEKNKGYGGNLKTCFRLALERNADVVVMLHPDYQYDGRLIPFFLGYLNLGICDVILGSRIRSRAEALAGGMPFWKYMFNRALTMVENMALGQNLGDAHSGFRCFTRKVLETIPYENNSDDFVFDTEFLAQVVYFGFKLGDAPMPVRYTDISSSISFFRSLNYGFSSFFVMVKYWLARLGLYRAQIFS